jgi:hypothetical protein
MKPVRLDLILTALIAMTLISCGQPKDPLPQIHQDIKTKGTSTYSIVLSDMQAEGNFIKNYSHSYRVITPKQKFSYGPLDVPKKMFDYYRPYLGMTIWSQKDGEGGQNLAPPGYAYVGDPRYGQWRTDSSGRSFWMFYGQYRLLSDLLGLGGRVYRGQYDRYRGYRSQNRPYYGPNQNYGTNGTITRKQYPDFFQRQQSRARTTSTSFSNKVNQRIGRSRTVTRGRSFMGGK